MCLTLGMRKGDTFFMQSSFVGEQKLINASASEYLGYLNNSSEGFIFKCQKKYHHGEEIFLSDYYRKDQLIGQSFADKNDTYISLNTFHNSKNTHKPERKVSCVKRLNALYVDIDCYKEGMRNDIVLKDLEERVFGSELPYPTFVIDSGRGLYLIWKFSKSEDKNALPRWSRTQDYLINALSRYGADSACRDAARVFRVPNTINSKSGTRVTILRYYEKEYTLYQIMKELEIDYSFVKQQKKSRPASEKQIRCATYIASKTGAELPDFSSRSDTYKFIEQHQSLVDTRKDNNIIYFGAYSPKQLLKGYLEDLHTLFSMRNKPDCKREIALFLCRLWNNEVYGDDERALSETLSFNNSFSYPFTDKYVIKTTESAPKKIAKGEKYSYKKKTLIELLEITSEEMNNLRYLVVRSDAEKKILKKKNNHDSYVMKLIKNGETTKASKIADRISAMKEFIEQGMSVEEIMERLSISKATYYRMLNRIECKDPDVSVKESKDGNELSLENTVSISSIPEHLNEDVFSDNPSIKLMNFVINRIFSFFKTLYWKRALALQPMIINLFNILLFCTGIYGINLSSPDGYECMDDSGGHDTG